MMIAEPNAAGPLAAALAAWDHRRARTLQRVRPHPISRFEQTQGRSPRRLLRLGRRGQLREHRAAGKVMPLFVRVNDVVVERGQFAEAGAIEEG